jgi:2,3-bisphosphoglycerate-independent phosphoglycerate mutase
VERALAVAPNHAEALEVRGTLRYLHHLLRIEADPELDHALFVDGQRDLERAVTLNPRLSSAHAILSHVYLNSDDVARSVIAARRAFEEDDFKAFDRGQRPDVVYAGMLEYDGDLHIPKRYLVPPPEIRNTMGEYFAASGVTQLAISETQKYGHVTYFWNGNNSGKFDGETWIEIPSDRVSFDERPWMKAAEITDALISELRTGKHRTARVNYANGDMVGHTGSLRAATMAMEAVDLCLARLLPVIDELGGMAIVTADHGNADEMYEIDKKTGEPVKAKDGSVKAKTSHTLNPVPCIFYDNVHKGKYKLADTAAPGLANLAATTANLLGFEAPEIWHPSLIRL